MRDLAKEERLRLLRFVCSFAWTDLNVAEEEREFVGRLVDRMKVGDDERRQVQEWLDCPPAPEEVDPTDVPREHRELFVTAVRNLVAADGRIADRERESLALLEELLR